MKTTINSLIAAAFSVALATSVSASPPGKGPLEPETFKHSAPGKQAPAPKEVAVYRHDGASVDCGSCQKKLTVEHLGPPGKGLDTSKVTYVNEQGRECGSSSR